MLDIVKVQACLIPGLLYLCDYNKYPQLLKAITLFLYTLPTQKWNIPCSIHKFLLSDNLSTNLTLHNHACHFQWKVIRVTWI